jgi:nucleoside-diphosphate-sugar epimerase
VLIKKEIVMKKIIVTGGAGYVGSRVAVKLADLGYSVIVVDIVTPEERGIIFPEGIEFRQHDLRIASEAEKALVGGEVVLQLAADIGSLTYMHDHQAEIMANNGAIDASVYPALVKNKIPWVIYSSSSMVFQHPTQFPYTEKDITKINPPTNVYGFSKLSGEYFCRAYNEQYGLNYTIIRYHNIYGAGEDSKGATPGDIHVIPALLEKVIGGQYPLEFLGDPAATRPFTYVDDAVEATVAIVERAARGDETIKNDDFNIGNNKYYTILELGEIIWHMFGDGREFAYKVIETKANTALRREVDITKIKTTLGWEPKTSLEEGLKPTAEWIKRRKQEGKRSLWQ